MRRFFVSIPEDSPSRIDFDREESVHIQRVLRLSEGDEINVFDGIGNEYRCLLEEFQGKSASARVVERVAPSAKESPLVLTLGVTLTPIDKFELVIQKSVELGVSAIVPLSTIRSEVRAKTANKKLERWRKIIIEASKQCGRATLMKISQPQGFESFVETAEGVKIMFSERGGSSFAEIGLDKNITALVGPKGGWDDSELEFARDNNFSIVTFGGRILRAETAAISITTILQHRFGDIN